jgi:hypothetical protein
MAPRKKDGPIEWRVSSALGSVYRRSDDRAVRQTIAVNLASNVEGYEGDYALHVLTDTNQLVLVVRDQEKGLLVYDCRIERYGVVREDPSKKKEEARPIRRPLKDWL